MRRYLRAVVVLLPSVLVLSCLAPAAAAGPLYVGVHGGTSIPSLRDNGGNALSSGFSTRVAPYFGAWLDDQIAPGFSVQVELDYAAQGGKRNGVQPLENDVPGLLVPAGTTLYASFKNTAKLNYLEVPVLAKFHFGTAHQFFAAIGPYAGYLLSAKTETSGQSPIYLDAARTQEVAPTQDFGATTDNRSDLHLWNFGMQAGVGFAQEVAHGFVTLDLRGGLGLTNIQKDTAANGKNSTGNLVIALGYSFLASGADEH